MKPLNVMVLFDTAGTPPENQDFTEDLKTPEWKTESDVITALTHLGHKVSMVGAYDDVNVIIHGIRKYKPDVVFNLMEHFKGRSEYDRNIPALLELMGVRYTGANPTAFMLCGHKAIAKQLLVHHSIRTPQFTTAKLKKTFLRPKSLSFPLLVKPIRTDASYGISQASFVENDDDLAARVKYIHDTFSQDALVEEYIVGRELYASIMGHQKLSIFPVRELCFTEVPDDEPKIATYKAKWDDAYRKKWGIKNRFANPIAAEAMESLTATCKQAYQVLHGRGYARIDLRLTPKNEVVIIEVNPNPFLADGEDFAESAKKSGLSYDDLIQRIVNIGMNVEV
jgi:D-alanine-D-alanine ligase